MAAAVDRIGVAPPPPAFAGVDVSAKAFHVVAGADRWTADDAFALAGELAAAGVERVAIDAPAGVSALAHARDETLSPKFRAARCSEVALGLEHGSWVSWVPPAERPGAAWMEAGWALFDACRARGLDAIETWPHAVFRALAGGTRLPKKRTAAGMAARVALLGLDGPGWTHDAVDAAACALVASDPGAVRVTCGHDGSAIWLPSPR